MRVDVPIMMCDRCRKTTQDLSEMASYTRLGYDHMSGRENYDLCQDCMALFMAFTKEGE